VYICELKLANGVVVLFKVCGIPNKELHLAFSFVHEQDTCKVHIPLIVVSTVSRVENLLSSQLFLQPSQSLKL
jgi:hypothetical protein